MTGHNGKLIDDDFLGPFIEGPGDDYCERAWEAETPAAQIRLARKALDMCLDCSDGYYLLAINAKTLGEEIALLRAAVAVGERLWAPLLGDPEVQWWSFIGTRPFMRALHALGLALQRAGCGDEAIAIFRRLLQMNPDDNQGVRYLILAHCAGQQDYAACREVFDAYPDDWGLEALATRLVIELAADDRDKAKATRAALDEVNVYFVPQLEESLASGKWPTGISDFITVGGVDEAQAVLETLEPAWRANPNLEKRLRELTKT